MLANCVRASGLAAVVARGRVILWTTVLACVIADVAASIQSKTIQGMQTHELNTSVFRLAGKCSRAARAAAMSLALVCGKREWKREWVSLRRVACVAAAMRNTNSSLLELIR